MENDYSNIYTLQIHSGTTQYCLRLHNGFEKQHGLNISVKTKFSTRTNALRF